MRSELTADCRAKGGAELFVKQPHVHDEQQGTADFKDRRKETAI